MYFHNLSNYDAHFIIIELTVDRGDVNVLANTEEKYVTFSKHLKYPGAGPRSASKLQFVNSYRFLTMPLEILASILPVDKKKFRSHFNDSEEFELLQHKGVFPYEHTTSQ